MCYDNKYFISLESLPLRQFFLTAYAHYFQDISSSQLKRCYFSMTFR